MQIAIIPARGGSKRIPRKNIKDFLGCPIIGWSIKAALDSALFDDVIVSTDDDEIAVISRKLGASVPFIRPAELSGDMATTRGVINHAIREVESIKQNKVTAVCCLLATAPFVQSSDLQDARKKLDLSLDFIFSAASYPFPVQRGVTLNQDGGVQMLFPEYSSTRSQDLEEVYHDAGQFYWGWRDSYLNEIPMFSRGSHAYILPRFRVQDIDTLEDWTVAERLFQAF